MTDPRITAEQAREAADVLHSVMHEHSPNSDLCGDYDCRFSEGQTRAFKNAIAVLRAHDPRPADE